MEDIPSLEDLKLRQKLLQRNIQTTQDGLEEEEDSAEVFPVFKREVEDWLEEFEGVSFGIEQQLAREED